MENKLEFELAKAEKDSESVKDCYKKYLYLDITIYSDTESKADNMLSDFEAELNNLLKENTCYHLGSLLRCTKYGESESNQLWDSMGFLKEINDSVTKQKQLIIESSRKARMIILEKYH